MKSFGCFIFCVFGISLSCGMLQPHPIPDSELSEFKCNPVYLQQMFVQTYQNKSWTRDGYRLIFRNFVPYFQREIDVASWWNRLNVSEIHINNVYGLFEFDMGPMMFLSHLTNVTITGSGMRYLYNSMLKRLKCFENDQPRKVFIERFNFPFQFSFEQKPWDRLVYLDLHDNDLRYLDFNIFQNMNKLEYFFLHDNPKLNKFDSAHTLLTLVNVEQFTYDKFVACDFHILMDVFQYLAKHMKTLKDKNFLYQSIPKASKDCQQFLIRSIVDTKKDILTYIKNNADYFY